MSKICVDVSMESSSNSYDKDVLSFNPNSSNGIVNLPQNGLPGSAPLCHRQICIADSRNIHIGNRTFYQGPVTVKQIVYSNSKTLQESDSEVVSNRKVAENSGVKNGFIAKFSRDATPESVQEKSGHKHGCFQEYSRQQIFAIFGLISFCLSCLAIAFLLIPYNFNLDNKPSITKDPLLSIEDISDRPINSNSTHTGKLKIVARIEWLALPPTGHLYALQTVVPFVLITNTQTGNCYSEAECIFQLRFLQSTHLAMGAHDIKYNFLIGGDGKCYEGRGWETQSDDTFNYNQNSIQIAFIGSFDDFKPPQRQIKACQNLIALGVKLGYINTSYDLLGKRQLQEAETPGNKLFDEIKTWEHWSDNPQ